jgi:tRNA (adenine57-N1/adenine58-N1)-methyltransferase
MLHEGEAVYLLDEKGRRHQLLLQKGMMKIPSLGVIDTSKLIGLEEGSTVTVAGQRFHVLRPGLPELMRSLERGAQIITPKDAATILLECDIRPGKSVLEVGAGSGGLTTALLSAVGGEGRVLTLELREDFASRARRNVSRAGLDGRWEVAIGDAKNAVVEGEFDAMVMDMPSPWEALENLDRNLRLGGRFCAYVPNVNQLEATVRALRESGYLEVWALENLQREMEVHPGGARPSFEMLGHTGYLILGRKGEK